MASSSPLKRTWIARGQQVSWRNLIWILIILALGALALHLAARKPPPRIDPGEAAVDELAGAIRAYKLLKEYGYRVTEPAQATQGAIEGMVRQVDDFSVYIHPDQAEDFARRATGGRAGTGLRIRRQGEKLFVIGPMAGSPAHEAGVFAPTEIIAINKMDAADLSLDHARELLAGEAGGEVPLVLANAKGDQTILALENDYYDTETVRGLVRGDDGQWIYALDADKGIYYLRICEFVSRTPIELRHAYRQFDDPKALILDLRGNPGGDRTAGVAVADRFLPDGIIGLTETRTGERHTHRAHGDETFTPIPTIVLIDKRTASAAEIVAGALQVHGRGVLLGERSYGKWSVQTTIDLGRGLGLMHLTTGRFYLTEPLTIGGVGAATATAPARSSREPAPLAPDISITLTSRAAERLEELHVRAMVIPGPVDDAGDRVRRDERAKELCELILERDTQLARALELHQEQRVPTTRPAGGSILTTRPTGEAGSKRAPKR